MIWLLPGIASFVFFLLFDILKAQGRRNATPMFILGALLLAGSTGMMVLSTAFPERPLWRSLSGIVAVVWLFTLLYVLFAALPANKTYAGTERLEVCSAGPYALCRHPGGWCFVFLYWFLWLYAPSKEMLAAAIVFPILNFVYIWVQDRYLFPKYINNYSFYQQSVPFLLPTWRSIRNCLKR